MTAYALPNTASERLLLTKLRAYRAEAGRLIPMAEAALGGPLSAAERLEMIGVRFDQGFDEGWLPGVTRATFTALLRRGLVAHRDGLWYAENQERMPAVARREPKNALRLAAA